MHATVLAGQEAILLGMSRYRRDTSGSTYFFTVVSHRRRMILCHDPIRTALRDAWVRVRALRPFSTEALVLLPDHLHCIWTLPDDDRDFSRRWSLIKHHVSFACAGRFADVAVPRSRARHGDACIWQRRFWEHRIRDEADFERHMDYIHFNPVKHALVSSAIEWPYSTFHRYVQSGIYPVDWAGAPHLDALDLE